jgi:hypothetical protein
MLRSRNESEITEWFQKQLQDPSLQRLDQLKSGYHFVQLVHSIDPTLFDLSRCDFLASSAYHYEKNWKLLQEVTAPIGLGREYVVERLMQGDKQRDLHSFASYLKVQYEAMRRQRLVQRGETVPPLDVVDRSNAISASEPAISDFHCGSDNLSASCDDVVSNVRRLQQCYNAAAERRRAIEIRRKRLQQRKRDVPESDSVRSESERSLSLFSCLSENTTRLMRKPNTFHLGSGQVRSWVADVEVPTGGFSTPQQPDGKTFGFRAAVNCSVAAADAELYSSEALNMQSFTALKRMNIWDIVNNPQEFHQAFSDFHLQCIHDTDGERLGMRVVDVDEMVKGRAVCRRCVPAGGSECSEESEEEEAEDPWAEFDAMCRTP